MTTTSKKLKAFRGDKEQQPTCGLALWRLDVVSFGSGALLIFSSGVTERYRAVEYVLYFHSFFGFSCRQTEHGMPPKRQAVIVSSKL